MSERMITKLLVIKQHPDGGLIKIYDEEWFYAIRSAERMARRSREGPPAQANLSEATDGACVTVHVTASATISLN